MNDEYKKRKKKTVDQRFEKCLILKLAVELAQAGGSEDCS